MPHSVTLEAVQAAFPSRHWVTAHEVASALGLKVSPDAMGQMLGSLGLSRTSVRVGNLAPRVWLIRGRPRDFQPADVRAELLAHGFKAPEAYVNVARGTGKARVLKLTQLTPKAQETPFLSP
jgi:hypothetical protein